MIDLSGFRRLINASQNVYNQNPEHGSIILPHFDFYGNPQMTLCTMTHGRYLFRSAAFIPSPPSAALRVLRDPPKREGSIMLKCPEEEKCDISGS
jgi:hypothetical protein